MDFELHANRIDLVNALRGYVQGRLQFQLGRHAGHVRRLKLRLAEQDSATSNAAKLCFLAAKLVPSGELVVMETSTDLYTALSRAIQRFKRALGGSQT
jgi:ribosome-associated translation inhibitor RaiA